MRLPALRRPAATRRGATLILVAVMSSALVSLGALVINWSYIELTNTQLRSASDAAAKAAAVTMSQVQNQGQAKQAAKLVAAEYTVGGQSLRIRNRDIEFGNAESDGNGGYTFSAGVQPLNCARVVARCGPGSATASVSAVMGNLLETDEFELEKEAIAGRFDHDICIVVDRSASMAWDLTGVDFSYPEEYNNDSTLQNYFKPPHSTGSRWAKLRDSLGVFRDALASRDLNPNIGLVSYASNYTFGLFESERVTRNLLMDLNADEFLAAADVIAQSPLIGDTNIAAGINNGRSVLLSSSERRVTANRTLILFSDGVKTEGGNPVTRAEVAADSRITIHTVSFGDGSDQEVMQQIAEAGNGNHYHADNAEELASAFAAIADELPAMLIQ